MRSPTIALAVEYKAGTPVLLETISDSREITTLEALVLQGKQNPLEKIRQQREKQNREDDEFSDYVEDLLCKPFLKVDIQRYGLQWLKSKIRIEKYQRDETEAANIIAKYAFDVFSKQNQMRDFFIAGPKTQIRVRVFVLGEAEPNAQAA